MNDAFRRLTLLLLAFVLALATGLARPDGARADDGDDGGRSGDNAAIAINTKSGSSLFKFAFSIRQVAGDVVDQTNAAVAYSSCEECQTTAIAIQIVLVTGSPSVVTPTNLAIAINENCTLCETFAGAYQIVLGTGGPVRFTDEGRRRIVEITREIRRLRDADLSPFELKSRLDVLVGQLKSVLATELVPIGPGEGEQAGADEQVTADEPLEEPPKQGQATTTGEQSITTATTPTTTTTTTTATTAPSATTTGPTTTGTTTEPTATAVTTTTP
jgi:putative peptide zinc metalloprotease protein